MSSKMLNPVAFVMAQNMAKYADKVAVKVKGEELSYATLNRMADDILNKLHFTLGNIQESSDEASSRDIKIGVYLPRDRYLIPAIWAVIKGGYTYVPLDVETPIERLKFILKDCGVSAVLCETSSIGLLDDTLTVDVLSTTTNGVQKDKVNLTEFRPSEIAYIIYTSGTTGKPKGVPVSYQSLLNFLYTVSLPDNFNISANSILLCFASINFDASILDIMAPLYYGGTIILADENQRRDIMQLYFLLKEERVTIVLLPPSLMTLMPDFAFPSMDTLIIGGEKMLPSIVQRTSGFHYRLLNAYGPTENTVISTVREMTPGISCENIGRTIPGVVGHVLKPDLTPAEIGEIGELCIGGVQLTSGYINRPELNQEKFIENPFEDKSEAPILYKTGDLVRLMTDGSYDFIGRKDTQVKFNGYRIELEEIAKAIEQCAGVVQACVLVESKGTGESLVAYVKFEGSLVGDEFEKIKKRIRQYLPQYMIPSAWVRIDEFPRNINGKIDRGRLSAYAQNTETESSKLVNTPTNKNQKEEIVSQVIANILERDVVDVDCDLFNDLGMTSIQIMQVPMNLEMFGIQISVSDIYANRTIRKILKNHQPQLSHWFNEPTADKPVLVVVSGYTSFSFLYSDFAKGLSDLYSIFVFESYQEETESVASSCESLISYYMDTLLPIAQQYKIAAITGFCLGGELGLLLAHELYKQTAILPHVVVLDGEVFRSRIKEEYIPTYMDFLPEKINVERFNRDMDLIQSMPDFHYEGKVTSILANQYDDSLPPFSQKLKPTKLQIECARYFYERTPIMWKKYYPDCNLFYVDAVHLTFLRDSKNVKPIVEYFCKIVTHSI